MLVAFLGLGTLCVPLMVRKFRPFRAEFMGLGSGRRLFTTNFSVLHFEPGKSTTKHEERGVAIYLGDNRMGKGHSPSHEFYSIVARGGAASVAAAIHLGTIVV